MHLYHPFANRLYVFRFCFDSFFPLKSVSVNLFVCFTLSMFNIWRVFFLAGEKEGSREEKYQAREEDPEGRAEEV